jgi:hypothetical protein
LVSEVSNSTQNAPGAPPALAITSLIVPAHGSSLRLSELTFTDTREHFRRGTPQLLEGLHPRTMPLTPCRIEEGISCLEITTDPDALSRKFDRLIIMSMTVQDVPANLAPESRRMVAEVQPQEIQRRRRSRAGWIWVLGLVILAGNLFDVWPGNRVWGPEQQSSDGMHRFWFTLSAGMFWIAAALFVLCVRDLFSIGKHRGVPPPTQEDKDRVELAVSGAQPDAAPVDQTRLAKARRSASNNVALLGVIGVAGGALFGHFFWHP